MRDADVRLLTGGHIYSTTNPDATAMAVAGDTVVWIGEDATGRSLHPGAQEVALDGAFVAPAFVDAHVHLTATGLQLTGLDLSNCDSREDCLRAVAAAAATHELPSDGVLWGHGWDESRWPRAAAPSTADLDTAAPGVALYLTRIDAHSGLASTALRERVPQLASADGYHPDGPLTGDAHHLVRRAALAGLDERALERARLAALDHAAAQGIVCVHECGGPEIGGRDDLRAVLDLRHGVERRGYWGEVATSAEHASALLADTGAHALGGDLFVDGSLGSHTALLGEPYADAPSTRGHRFLDQTQLTAHIRACTEARVQAGFHAIGDGAVGATVAAFAAVVDELGGPTVAARGHRIEHLEMVTADQAAQLGRCGVIGSVQPMFDSRWGGPDGMYAQRLGSDRAVRLNPFAALASAGVSLALGSDAPVTAMQPWAAIRAAVHHRTEGSGISPRAAFAAATRGAWRAGGVRDGVTGTLVPGAPASYAVWSVGDLVVQAAKDSVQRWSTDPRSRVPALPTLDPGAPAPVCLQTVHRGDVVFGS